jgi:hypothetical protein
MNDERDILGTVDGGVADERPSRRELLLNRVVDGEATDGEWTEFRSMADAEFAGADRCAWRDLAEGQRTHAVLSAALGPELSAAERVELPTRAAAMRVDRYGATAPVPPVALRLGAFGGWLAAAAAVLVIWFNGWGPGMLRLESGSVGQEAGMASPANLFRLNSPEDALAAYKTLGGREGTVVCEMPDRVLVDSSPLKEGQGFEVVYIRQIVERRRVPDLYKAALDEGGNAVLMPVRAARRPVQPD